MKKFASVIFVVFISVAIAYSSLIATPAIMNMEVDGKKIHHTEHNGKKVNDCSYCHGGAGIAMTKNNLLEGQENYNKLTEMPKCSGSGCHVK